MFRTHLQLRYLQFCEIQLSQTDKRHTIRTPHALINLITQVQILSHVESGKAGQEVLLTLRLDSSIVAVAAQVSHIRP